MASINFSGVGSGIDFSQIVDAIVADRTAPVTQLQSKSSDYTVRASALKQLNALLVTFTQAADALSDRALGTGFDALSNDNTVATATASSTAAPGAVNLQVTRLATPLVQASRSYGSADAAVLPDGVTEATFTLRKGGAAAAEDPQITIDADNNSLTGLRDAINAAKAGVTASIVDVTGAGSFQLVLTSSATGAAGRVELVEQGATGALASLGLRRLDSPADPNDFSNLDASLTVNGLAVTRPTNTVADAVTGVTLNLNKVGSAVVTLRPSADVTQKLQAFVSAYNAVQEFANTQYKPDGQGRPSGVLAGDPTLRSVQRQLRDAVSASAGDGPLKNLAELGVGRDEAGKLTLDTAKLNAQLTASRADVLALIRGEGDAESGVAQAVHSVAKNLSDGISGTVTTAIKGYQDSIKSIDKSVADKLASLGRLRASLAQQYAKLDAAIGQLNSQGTTLTNIFKSMQPKSDD